MADITVKVLDPATSIAFVTLDEVKTFLGITTTTTEDNQLTLMIDIASATIMRVCNRYMAQERVVESWREVANGRLFLTHWPVVETDIESVTVGDGSAGPLDPSGYELEEQSGKLSNYATGGWSSPPTTVTYTGGFVLPDDAPLPLKQACLLMVRDSKLAAARLSITGIRSLSHKDSRVQFFDYTKPPPVSAGSGMPRLTGDPSVDAILYHYTRLWV